MNGHQSDWVTGPLESKNRSNCYGLNGGMYLLGIEIFVRLKDLNDLKSSFLKKNSADVYIKQFVQAIIFVAPITAMFYIVLFSHIFGDSLILLCP